MSQHGAHFPGTHTPGSWPSTSSCPCSMQTTCSVVILNAESLVLKKSSHSFLEPSSIAIRMEPNCLALIKVEKHVGHKEKVASVTVTSRSGVEQNEHACFMQSNIHKSILSNHGFCVGSIP